jgi:hypothetical protein
MISFFGCHSRGVVKKSFVIKKISAVSADSYSEKKFMYHEQVIVRDHLRHSSQQQNKVM